MNEDAWIEQCLYAEELYGDWEKDALMIWTDLAGRSEMIIDMGANTSVYSLLAQCNNASVIAIAPFEINRQVLTTNLQINNDTIRVEKIVLYVQCLKPFIGFSTTNLGVLKAEFDCCEIVSGFH